MATQLQRPHRALVAERAYTGRPVSHCHSTSRSHPPYVRIGV